jgi:hypothetical protein
LEALSLEAGTIPHRSQRTAPRGSIDTVKWSGRYCQRSRA